MKNRKNRIFKKALSLLLAFILCTSGVFGGFIGVYAATETTAGTDPLSELSRENFFAVLDAFNIDDTIPRYYDYIANKPAARPNTPITVEAADFARYMENGEDVSPERYQDYQGEAGVSVLSGEDSIIEYIVTAPEAGLYEVSMRYYPVHGKSSPIQRGVFVNGKLPFKEFALVEFCRMWRFETPGGYADDAGIWRHAWERDNQGNDLKPQVSETPDWITSYFYDSNGYVLDELSVWLEAGENRLSLVAMREPVIIRSITFSNKPARLTYAEQKAAWDAQGAQATYGHTIRVEAENAVRTSSQMLYPIQDQSSPAVVPSSARALLNNSIGGNSWSTAGQWLEWEFYVPESGYYNIALQVKQNFQRGIPVNRKISINGVVPFAELAAVRFSYGQNWREEFLKPGENFEPYLIYLQEGRNVIRMEAVLGDFAEIISLMQETVYDLNTIYRSAIRILGVEPDQHRDYQIERNIPALGGQLVAARDKINRVIEMLHAAAPESSDKAAVLLTMRDQLNDLIRDRERFTRTLAAFRENSRACGMWITQVLSMPLQIDALTIVSPGTETGQRRAGFWASLWFELQKLFFSFIIDYNQIGNVATDKDTKSITLWIGTGRDQANIIKSLIDRTFTSEQNINVNVMIVDMSTLLQATLAGQGPDVAIQVTNDVPMNYGLRNAVADLRQFEDLDEVMSRFHHSAMVPMMYDNFVFGLPETQTFPMMFYRKDVLREIGVTSLPDTWDDVLVLMSVLAKNQMEFGMFPTEPNFATILFQNGGDYYTEDATRSALDTEEAINAFKIYCNYYTDYRLDRITSVEERFRTGEAPIIITDYTFYNNLQVSAPDLKGVWGFAPVPGTRREDGSIDRSVASGGLACVMLQASRDKQSAWEFMKWWTSAETQVLYGREMESLLGASARVPAANIEAFGMLPWPRAEFEALSRQFEEARGIRQVPGGYFTFRNVDNAFYRVTNSDTGAISPREELTDKIILINDEIRYKRIEFGMELGDNR